MIYGLTPAATILTGYRVLACASTSTARTPSLSAPCAARSRSWRRRRRFSVVACLFNVLFALLFLPILSSFCFVVLSFICVIAWSLVFAFMCEVASSFSLVPPRVAIVIWVRQTVHEDHRWTAGSSSGKISFSKLTCVTSPRVRLSRRNLRKKEEATNLDSVPYRISRSV